MIKSHPKELFIDYLDPEAICTPTVKDQWSGPLRKYKKSISNDDIRKMLPNSPLKILDIGCGHNKFESRGIDTVIGVDHNFFDGVDIVIDLTRDRLPLDDSTVDFVYSSHFIEHLDYIERDRVFHEVLRVLKPGGGFFFRVPHFSHYWQSAYDHKIHNYGVGVAHTIANASWYSHIPFFHVVGVGLNWRVTPKNKLINDGINRLLNKSFRLSEAYLCWVIGGIQEIQYLLVKPKK